MPHTLRPLFFQRRPVDIDFAIRRQWFLMPRILQKTHCGSLEVLFIGQETWRERQVAWQGGNRLVARWYFRDGMKKISAQWPPQFCAPSAKESLKGERCLTTLELHTTIPSRFVMPDYYRRILEAPPLCSSNRVELTIAQIKAKDKCLV